MLDKKDFVKAIEYLIAIYPEMEKQFNSQTTQGVWFDLLQDIDGRTLLLAIKTYASTEKFAPKPSQIREMAIMTTRETRDWTEGWDLVLRSIGRFGTYKESEALDWIRKQDETAAESIRRLGYKNLCLADDQMAVRANFRQAYNNQLSKNKFYDQLPDNTRFAIEENRARAKLQLKGIANNDLALEMLNAIGD
ncbi:MAG: hypothetical protein KHZ82_02545 [Peptoniphilus harei]|nr:hypothetical protein [Peptoniphilus harei]